MGIRIYGHSDDLVIVDQEGTKREIQTGGGGVRITLGTKETRGLVVEARYGVGEELGVWTLKVHQVDEGVPVLGPLCLVDHPVTGLGGKPAKSYSLALVVDADTVGIPVSWERVH